MSSANSAIILGAGLVGRLLAVCLARTGISVEVHESSREDVNTSAAYIAAAMLAPLAESAITEASVVKMGLYSLPRWKELVSSFKKHVFFQQAGTLILWHGQDQSEAFRFQEILSNRANETTSLKAPIKVDYDRIQQLEPNLSNHLRQGLLLEDEGQLDNRQVLDALLDEMQTLGVKIHWSSPKNVEDFASLNPNQWLVDCRGIGSKSEWPEVRGVRGEVIRLHAPEVHLNRPVRLIHPKYPIYIAPKENNQFVIGATEIETDDLSAISVRSTLELLSAAYTVHSGFAEARILETSTNLRPTLFDNLPKIEMIANNQLRINGLYRHGFMISPAVVDAVMELMTKNSSALVNQLNINYAESK
jgi:glycine oxidase